MNLILLSANEDQLLYSINQASDSLTAEIRISADLITLLLYLIKDGPGLGEFSCKAAILATLCT